MQISQLSDLDELVLLCRSDGAKMHIQEAILAYKAGAFRASIVSTWIAVVFDFVDKIRELALAGSKNAKNWIDDYERCQLQYEQGNKQSLNRLLAFENEILFTSR
jgi:hypothetical protein